MAAPLILELLKDLQDRAQLTGPQRAGPAHLLLVFRQVGGQPSLAQEPHRSWPQLPQIKLLGLIMREVIIPAGAAIAGRQAHRFEAASAVAGAPVFAFIDIALHRDHRMAPLLLPVPVESLER